MANQEVLTLIATAQDKASPALRQIQRSLTELNKAGADLNKQSTALQHLNKAWEGLGAAARKSREDQKHIREYGERFKELGERGKRVAEVATKDILPALSGINIGAITATGAVVGLTEAAKKFAEQSGNMANFGRQFGFAIKDLQGLEGVAERFQVSGEVIKQTLANISREMDKVRGRPDMGGPDSILNKLRMGPGTQGAAMDVQRIVGNRNLSTEQQNLRVYMRLLEEAKRIEGQRGPAYAGSFLEQFGIDRSNLNLLKEGKGALEEAMAAAIKLQGQLDPAKAEKYRESMENLSNALIGIRNSLGGQTISYITEFNEQVAKFLGAEGTKNWLHDEITKDIAALKELFDELKAVYDFLHKGSTPAGALQNMQEHQRAQSSSVPNFGAGGYGGGSTVGAATNQFGQPYAPPGGMRWPSWLPHLASGGTVEESGVAVIHKGETITPAGQGDPEQKRVTEENTREMHRLNDKLQRLMDEKLAGGGTGAPGTGAYGASAGPMFRPGGAGGTGIGPGAAQGRGPGAQGAIVTPHVPPKEAMPAHPAHTPGATETPGPQGGKLTTPPASSVPPPSMLPGLAEGGIVPARPGGTIAVIGEGGQDEAVVPLGVRPTSEGAAAFRYNNPGAQAINSAARQFFGATVNPQIGPNPADHITDFPNKELGAASNMYLFAHSPRYLGQTVAAGQHTWSSGIRSGLPGIDPNQIITPELVKNEEFMTNLMKATGKAELGKEYPMTDAQWHSAYQRYMAASDRTEKGLAPPNPSGADPGGRQGPATATPPQGGAHPGWPTYPGVMSEGAPRLGPDGRPITGGTTEYGASPRHMGAELQFGDKTYNVGSGGNKNFNAIPYGNYEITPGATGPIIKGLGGMTLQNNQFMDPVRNRLTQGIAIHPAGNHGQGNITDGCVGFNNNDWNQIKPGIQDALKQGPEYLNVTPKGMRISSTGAPYSTPGTPGEWDKFAKGSYQGPPTSGSMMGQTLGKSTGLGPMWEKSIPAGHGAPSPPTLNPAAMNPAAAMPSAASNPAAAHAASTHEGLAPPDVGTLGLTQHPVGSLDRSSMTHKVEGSGKIDVNVAAPKGTNVKASGGGMFNTVKVNRQSSMPHVDEQH